MAIPADVVTGEIISSTWGNAVRDWAAEGQVDGSTTTTAIPTGTAYLTVATVNLTIPAEWVNWSCFAYASFMHSHSTPSVTANVRLQIDGSDQTEIVAVPTSTIASAQMGFSFGAHRTGMTTTGSRSVLLRFKPNIGTGTWGMAYIFLYARGVRTA